MFEGQKGLVYETPSSLIYPRKLDTALRASTVTNFIDRVMNNELSLDDQLITHHFTTPELLEAKIAPELYSRLLGQVFLDSDSRYIRYTHKQGSWLRRSLASVNKNIEIQTGWMLSQVYLPFKEQALRDMQERHQTNEIPLLFENIAWLCHEFAKIIQKLYRIDAPKHLKKEPSEMIREQCRHNFTTIDTLLLTIYWSHSIAVFRYDDELYVTPQPYILMIHNKLADLMSVLIYAHSSNNGMYGPHSFDITISFVKEIVQLCQEYKSKFFTLIKSLEAFVTGEILIEVDEWDNSNFLTSVARDLDDKIGYYYKGSELQRILKRAEIPLRYELGCLSKILGHPFVDMEGGTKSLHQKTTEPLPINQLKVIDCTCYVKENYIRNHITKYKTWPPCEVISDFAPRILIEAIARGLDPNSHILTRKYPPMQLSDYCCVELRPNRRFAKLENFLPYLKDKTITLLRSQLFNDHLDGLKEDTSKNWANTRLLLAYLLNPRIVTDHVNYLDRYTHADTLDEFLDYLVIRIVPKEKELKELFRGFGCKTGLERARALVQEKNTMMFLEEFSDEQAMAIGEIDLSKKLYAFRTIQKTYRNHHVLRITVDASAWNNRHRSEVIDKVMSQTLDQIYEWPIFSKTHLNYEHSVFYVPDEKSTYIWDGQQGGIEGLNQDTWVVVYIAELKTALARFNLRYHLLVKGDDARVIVIIPPEYLKGQNVSLGELKNQLVTEIATVLGQFGQKINIQESYGSEHFFAFSKDASCGTIELPQAYRKIQKCYGANNAFLPFADEYIASTFSNAHSACKASTSSVACYKVALTWTQYYYIYGTDFHGLTDLERCAFSLIPSVVGGLPMIYLHNMSVRAEADLLTPFIDLCYFCKAYYPDVYNLLKRFMRVQLDPNPDPSGLLADPYAIPLDKPPLPSTVLRKDMYPILKAIVKNEDVRDLFEADTEEVQERFKRIVKSMNVYNPKVLALLHASTPSGLIDELIRKFESSRSVQQLLIIKHGLYRTNKMLSRLVRIEHRLQTWRVERLRGLNLETSKSFEHWEARCSAEHANSVRERCWKKPVESITMPALQHLMHYASPLEGGKDEYSCLNHFEYKIHPPILGITRTPSRHFATSGLKPFLGHSTSTGTIAPLVHFSEKDPMLSKMKSLLELISWTSKTSIGPGGEMITSNIDVLIRYIMGLYTKEPIENLAPFAGQQKSGTIAHHIRAPSFRESIVPNCLSNIYQQISGDSNTHVKFRTVADHFYVNFLHILCHSMKILSFELEFGTLTTVPPYVWGITTSCSYCTRPIIETPITLKEDLVPFRKLQPLKSTTIEATGMRILKDSYNAFLERGVLKDYSQEENIITRDIAYIGILQEIVEECLSTHDALADRYTHHHMTEEGLSNLAAITVKGYNRVIGQRELKRMPISTVGPKVAAIVYTSIFTRLKVNMELNIATALHLIPGEELPWYGLLKKFYSAGQLNALLRWFEIHTGLPSSSSYSHPISATKYIGEASYHYQMRNDMPLTVVILSYYKVPDLVGHLEPILDALKWKCYQHHYKASLPIRTYKKIKSQHQKKDDTKNRKEKVMEDIKEDQRDIPANITEGDNQEESSTAQELRQPDNLLEDDPLLDILLDLGYNPGVELLTNEEAEEADEREHDQDLDNDAVDTFDVTRLGLLDQRRYPNLSRADRQLEITKEAYIRLMAELVVISLLTSRCTEFQEYLISKLETNANNIDLILKSEECITQKLLSPERLTMNMVLHESPHLLYWLYKRYVRLDWNLVLTYIHENSAEVCQKVDMVFKLYPIRVIHTDLSTCISVVRSPGDVEEVAEEDLRLYDIIPRRDNEHILKISPIKGACMGIPNHDPGLMQITQPLPTYNFETKKFLLNASPYYTLLGSSTRGSCKLLDCLLALGIRFPLPDYLTIACLGEGEGGFIEVLSSFTHHSRFVYIARPEDHNEFTRPNLALPNLIRNKNSCISDHIEKGFWDLIQTRTMEYLEGYGLIYNIITCDAENLDIADRMELCRNVTLFFIRNKHESGIMIFKVFLYEVELINFMVRIGQCYCRSMFLFRSKASRVNAEHYFILQGVKTRIENLFDRRPIYYFSPPSISAAAYRSLSTYIEKYHEEFNALLVAKPRIYEFKINHPTSLRYAVRYMSPFILVLLHRQLKIGLPLKDLMTRIKESPSFTEFYKSFVTQTQTNLRAILRLIKGDNQDILSDQTTSMNTLTHKFKILEQYLLISGFLDAVVLVQFKDLVTHVLAENHIRAAYKERIIATGLYPLLAPTFSSHFMKTPEIYKIQYQGYERFCRGLWIYQSLYSTYMLYKGRKSRGARDKLKKTTEQ